MFFTGGAPLLDHVSFHISNGEKIGLVGKNGAGKSTLMKIICGLQAPSSGRVDKPSSLTVGYLPQIMSHHKGRTVIEEAMTAFDSLLEMERRMDEVQLQLASRTDYESDSYMALIEDLNDLSDRLEASKSEPLEVQARKTLRGLGFLDSELDRKTETFSQGWNMRIELAKILLSKPGVMLLDEPTNHLDIESIEWLEDYLKSCSSAIMLVSHDRKFLDSVTSRTIEIMLGHIYDYKVPYGKYLALREERLSQQTAAFENQQRMIEKTEDFINRFRYKPTKSNQVQSRIKALEKLDRIEIDETDNSTLTVKFPPAPRSGDVTWKASDLSAGYPQKLVFSGADMEIKRGEKVALVGRNGEGKTTLIRVIMGEIDPLAGESRIGHNVSIGYFAQNQEDVLDPKETVFSTLDRVAVGEARLRLRDILAAFLFRGEDIDKRVSVLSGGERARLGMALLMLKNYNFLVLDEPTNHMDIRSKDVLKQALLSYNGSLLIVSHDRGFLEGLVDKIYEFRGGKVREHLGGVSEFLRRRKIENMAELERKEKASAPHTPKAKAAPEKKEENKSRKVRDRISYLECEIGKLEKKLLSIEAILQAPGENDDIMELTRDYLETKRELDAKTEEWGSLI